MIDLPQRDLIDREFERQIHIGDDSIEVVPDPKRNAVTIRLGTTNRYGDGVWSEVTFTDFTQVDELINDLLHWRNVKWPWPKFREMTSG